MEHPGEGSSSAQHYCKYSGGPQLSHYFTTVEIFQATNNYLAGVIE